jgi:hypothetical protein
MGSDFTTQTESRELSNISDFQFMKLKTNLQKKSSTENLNSKKAKRNETVTNHNSKDLRPLDYVYTKRTKISKKEA